VTHERSDPLSTALACVRRLSDEGMDAVVRLIGDEREARQRDRLAQARWKGTRMFSRPGRLRAQVCLVVGSYGSLGLTGYFSTACGGHGYGVHPEPAEITCRACLDAGAAQTVSILRDGPT